MSGKQGNEATATWERPQSHFAVVVDDVVIGLVPDCSARTASLMAARDIFFERLDGPIAADEIGEIARLNAQRAARRGATLRVVPGGRGLLH
ncbi:MAG: hypothetical protein ABW252_22010 [Polyangiales bacterium]